MLSTRKRAHLDAMNCQGVPSNTLMSLMEGERAVQSMGRAWTFLVTVVTVILLEQRLNVGQSILSDRASSVS